MADAVLLKGYTELMRAFAKADKLLNKELRDSLKDAAEPVRREAEQLAVDKIRNVKEGDRWSRMRVGVTTKVVYVAPREHGKKWGPQKRPGFGPLLLDEAMIPALENQSDEIEKRVGDLLDDYAHFWTYGP